ncbi:hypothetical protein PR048_003120 [Dryococelus australis]|uniref:Uncharacterized protein n=1 Tax=Dryococelus australis TaxID=614101 RepID=A0ABQ9IM42_9NEOP|nr:hypothetical protein PR048_003120 [Dryococelus australis]
MIGQEVPRDVIQDGCLAPAAPAPELSFYKYLRNLSFSLTLPDENMEFLSNIPPRTNRPIKAGSLVVFAHGNRAGRCRWSASYLGDLLFPPAHAFQRCSISSSFLPHRLSPKLSTLNTPPNFIGKSHNQRTVTNRIATCIALHEKNKPFGISFRARCALHTNLCKKFSCKVGISPTNKGDRGGIVVRQLAFHIYEPGAITGRVIPGYSLRGNRAGRCHWSTGFLGDLPFYSPLHYGTAPYSPRFTVIGSQDLDCSGILLNLSLLPYRNKQETCPDSRHKQEGVACHRGEGEWEVWKVLRVKGTSSLLGVNLPSDTTAGVWIEQRMGKKQDLSEHYRCQTVGARRMGHSISDAVQALRFPRATVSRLYRSGQPVVAYNVWMTGVAVRYLGW